MNIGYTSKNGEQLRAIAKKVINQSSIVGGDDIHVFAATGGNEPGTALAVDLLTNYLGSVRCVVHTLSLAMKDVFENGTPLKQCMAHVEKFTFYFNHYPKFSQMLTQKKFEEGVTNDRIQNLKHYIPTRWYSRLSAMLA